MEVMAGCHSCEGDKRFMGSNLHKFTPYFHISCIAEEMSELEGFI